MRRKAQMAVRLCIAIFILLIPMVCMLSSIGCELHGSQAFYQVLVWLWFFVMLYIMTKEWDA